MNNPESQDPVEANAKKDAAHVKRLEELMAEMIQNGFVEYVDRNSGNKATLTFQTIISEGIDDAEGFIPAMHKCFKLSMQGAPFAYEARVDFWDQIEKLLITYIEDDVMTSEKRRLAWRDLSR